jgi:hypothetical protein
MQEMYTLKSIFKRGALFGAAGAMLVAAVLPAAAAFADELNPLTDRSLLLSSSAPGFTNTDGSGNATFAQPGSGPNGEKTGQTFSFKVSTPGATKPIKAFTLQYCTGAAGNCQAPGNNQKANPGYTNDNATSPGDFRNGGAYVVGTNATGRPDNVMAHPLGFSDLDVVGAWGEGTGPGEFQVLVDGAVVPGWTMTQSNEEDTDHSKQLTGKRNYITITATGDGSDEHLSGDEVKIVFKPSAGAYITNPGYGAFFVKLNTYNDAGVQINPVNDPTPADTSDQTTIDGGVTVANVMTDSIHITTKVLETMSFSVGTQNRDQVVVDCDDAGAITDPANPKKCEGTNAAHTKCDMVQNINNNRLNLGNPDAEYSLETGKAWDVNSYWRLSSNSSGGATVYYSGDTLQNTVGDDIDEIGAVKKTSTPGGEQFGLAFGGPDDESTYDAALKALPNYQARTIAPFNIATDTASAQYNSAGAGTTIDNGAGGPGTAAFAFQSSSAEVPVAIAKQNTDVISCATAKMRYVANIGADTPAGVYTTKINYLAAPQY